CQKYSGSLTF
nr:immunoglobulin light chain junction region [Macaca mulatta]MOX97568.1 immunoglobulin light chain junction region [Macaca mulatta]MOX98115.1 immunoglobulin light chain junction region [Macaca mulatta]MOX98470.1 immunoglobulin light chain junction region [Macaca mulatta]MOX99495.1 immunoglobulin light chain junction region [Macaca mulatta]